MDIAALIVVAALVLAAAALALFALMVISIRSDDRRLLNGTVPTHADGMTRRLIVAYAHRCHDTPAVCPERR
ncbi:hypothetical protein ACIBHY_47970 [Nonomuraea sp. NPDC050547]|uniref:hypothetical protein n=1 Tax=Nonomuraea sp. NPDC050547 TaxID=3364368 RepID=UPI0037A12865